jgi:hypothetical protein
MSGEELSIELPSITALEDSLCFQLYHLSECRILRTCSSKEHQEAYQARMQFRTFRVKPKCTLY